MQSLLFVLLVADATSAAFLFATCALRRSFDGSTTVLLLTCKEGLDDVLHIQPA
jgi:hypothetical protein